MSDAGRAEAEGVQTATVTWRGLTPFEVPRYRADWPFAAVLAAESEKWPTFLAEIMPPAALREFQMMRPTERDAYDLLNALTSALGFGEPGESPASAS